MNLSGFRERTDSAFVAGEDNKSYPWAFVFINTVATAQVQTLTILEWKINIQQQRLIPAANSKHVWKGPASGHVGTFR